MLFWSSLKRETSLRTEGRRAVYSAVRTLLGCGFLLCLALGTYWAGRLAWADHLSRSGILSDRIDAVRLFPSAALYDRLAEKREESGGNPVPDWQQAVALEPQNAAWRIRLGTRAELAGDYPLAESHLRKAAELSRLYLPRYLLAGYYFRRQNADQFHEWAREAFTSAYGDIGPLLDLYWRMRPDAESLARQAPAGRPELGAQFLLFFGQHHRTGSVRSLARTVVAEARRADLPALLQYCNECLNQGDAAAALDVWNALCARRLLPDERLDPPRGMSMTNARFVHRPADTAFDWRLEQAPWVRFAQMKSGMRVTFSGNQPERCRVASQFVPLLPGTRYRLRLQPVEAAQALEWAVFDATGKSLTGERTADGSYAFAAPVDLVRLDLMYQRRQGSMRLDGTLAIEGVVLELAR